MLCVEDRLDARRGTHRCWLGLAEVGGGSRTDEDDQVWAWADGSELEGGPYEWSGYESWGGGQPGNDGQDARGRVK